MNQTIHITTNGNSNLFTHIRLLITGDHLRNLTMFVRPTHKSMSNQLMSKFIWFLDVARDISLGNDKFMVRTVSTNVLNGRKSKSINNFEKAEIDFSIIVSINGEFLREAKKTNISYHLLFCKLKILDILFTSCFNRLVIQASKSTMFFNRTIHFSGEGTSGEGTTGEGTVKVERRMLKRFVNKPSFCRLPVKYTRNPLTKYSEGKHSTTKGSTDKPKCIYNQFREERREQTVNKFLNTSISVEGKPSSKVSLAELLRTH